MDTIQKAVVVAVMPTKIWIENDILGGVSVVLQHEGEQPFTYATFNYDYRYTSNLGTFKAATRLALELGATEPIEQRVNASILMPSESEVREQIAALQEYLRSLENKHAG